MLSQFFSPAIARDTPMHFVLNLSSLSSFQTILDNLDSPVQNR